MLILMFIDVRDFAVSKRRFGLKTYDRHMVRLSRVTLFLAEN